MRTTYEMKIDLWRLYVMDRRVKDTQWSSSVCSYINIFASKINMIWYHLCLEHDNYSLVYLNHHTHMIHYLVKACHMVWQ